MIKKSKFVIITLFSLSLVLVLEILYISSIKSMDDKVLKNKLEFVKTTKLPDLAISTEANYIRHRSLSDIYSIYRDDGSLREYFPSTFVLSHSHIKEDSL